MLISLPDYAPPNAQRATVAAGFAPLLVLLGFALMVVRLIDPDTGFALFAACTVWVLYEMHEYQRGLDEYDAEYVLRNLTWRPSAALRAMIEQPGTAEATRHFVNGFLASGRAALPEGQRT